MGQLSTGIRKVIASLGGDEEIAKKAHRAAQVREMWASCVDPVFLDHTNSVYILKEKEGKILIVYVDESIYAAELNARRELIKLKFLQTFNEDIEEFRILISRGNYKKNYPYKNKKGEKIKSPRELTKEEIKQIEEIAKIVENEKIQESLKQAMISDWQWRKRED
ncbi:MAG: DciA family protein [Raoultibacter sp.]|jgi:hypothetical protein